MLDIVDELRSFVGKLDEHQIDYALCGGMAMGVQPADGLHGPPISRYLSPLRACNGSD